MNHKWPKLDSGSLYKAEVELEYLSDNLVANLCTAFCPDNKSRWKGTEWDSFDNTLILTKVKNDWRPSKSSLKVVWGWGFNMLELNYKDGAQLHIWKKGEKNSFRPADGGKPRETELQ